jgi:hypothetical protein
LSFVTIKARGRAFYDSVFATDNMSNTFAAAFSVEDGHGYCFDYENIPQLRSMKIPPELETLLNTKVRNKENAKIASLSIGVDSRYWIRYFEDGKGWSNGTYDFDMGFNWRYLLT